MKQTAGRVQLGAFAPQFAQLNDDVLFGQVWSRTDELSLRDRSVITVTALLAQGLTDQAFRYHLQTAKAHGVTQAEIAALITHAAFYVGWPKAWAAFHLAKEVWCDEVADPTAQALARHAAGMLFPVGQPNDAYAQYFSGQSYLATLDEKAGVYNVTFEPGCRNAWHIHHAQEGGGQLLIAVAGRGFYQAWGQAPIEMTPGTIVMIEPGVKHWHGAAPDSWFSHLAIDVPGTQKRNEWLEALSDRDYEVATTTATHS